MTVEKLETQDVELNGDGANEGDALLGNSNNTQDVEFSSGGGGPDEGDALLGSNSSQSKKKKWRGGGKSLFSFFKRDKKGRRGHLRKESSVMQVISQRLEVVGEDVAETAVDVQNAFVEELQEADRGDVYFLDMSMTRSLSVPPDKLQAFAKEAAPSSMRRLVGIPEEEEEEPTKGGLPLVPFLSLLSAVAAVSSNGTALSLQKGVAPPLKLYWKMTATATALAFFAGKGIYNDGGFPTLSPAHWIAFMLAVVCFVILSLAFVIAIQYTSIGNAVIFANSQALLLLIGKAFTGTPIVWMEGTGALVAFSGALICAGTESTPPGTEDKLSLSMIGNALALLAAVGGVGYLTFAKSVRHTMSVNLFMFLIMFSGSFLVLAYMLITTSSGELTFDMNAYTGMFGWMNPRVDRLAIELWIVIVCNMAGTMGFLNAMQYFDNIVIAVATLLEPMAASLIAFALHVGELPNAIGWIGNILVVIGTVGVVAPSVNSGDGGGH